MIKLIKGQRIESLGGYSMIHNREMQKGRKGFVTKVTNHHFTVLLDGETKGTGFPFCGFNIFKVLENK